MAWRTVLAYAPMSNGKAERMVGTIKRSVKKMLLGTDTTWPKVLQSVLYGYRRRSLSGGPSPFERMYGAAPRMDVADIVVTGASTLHTRAVELLALTSVRAQQVEQATSVLPAQLPTMHFDVGDLVLVACGPSLTSMGKLPAFTSPYYGPCRVLAARHPRYEMMSPQGRISREPIHA